MRKVLVTGAAGFIGFHVSRRLLAQGNAVVGLDKRMGTKRLSTTMACWSKAARVPDWAYPVVTDLATGQLKLDDFGDRWGDRAHLDRFLQAYAVERARAEARKRGHQCTEAQLPDGSIRLTIQVNGGAA
jgi:nucleoside-diphosphate-sugar epimerase